MSEEMGFEGELHRLWKADPFIPFEIVITIGEKYEINDPSKVSISSDAVKIQLSNGDAWIIRKSQLVAIHVIVPVQIESPHVQKILDQLKERLRPRDFVPFTIVRKDGVRLHVPRKLAAATDGVRKVAVSTEHGFEHFTLSDIESIEVSEPREGK
jgi:hypothetical protein